MHRPKQATHFLSLPSELRQHILLSTLSNVEQILSCSNWRILHNAWCRKDVVRKILPNILLAQIASNYMWAYTLKEMHPHLQDDVDYVLQQHLKSDTAGIQEFCKEILEAEYRCARWCCQRMGSLTYVKEVVFDDTSMEGLGRAIEGVIDEGLNGQTFCGISLTVHEKAVWDAIVEVSFLRLRAHSRGFKDVSMGRGAT